jgi:hypothetical protein
MRKKQHRAPATAMVITRPKFSCSKSAEAMEGATMRGWVKPTTVLLMLVTARRLKKNIGDEGEKCFKRAVAPAVEVVPEHGCNSRVVPREDNLTRGRVYGKGNILQMKGGGQPEGLPGDTGSHHRQRAQVQLVFVLHPAKQGSDKKAHGVHAQSVTIMQCGKMGYAHMIENVVNKDEPSGP